MRLITRAVAAAGMVAGTFLSVDAGEARDLVVFAEPTLAPALEALGKAWRGGDGGELRVFKSPTTLALAQADRRIRCDLVVGLAGPAFENAEKDETLDRDTRAPFAANTLVLITQGDADLRMDSGGDIALLLAGKRLAIADPDRDLAGRYGVDGLRNAGVTIDPFNRSVAVAESSAGVITFLAEKRADLGIVYATDAKQAGFIRARPLPENTYPMIEYLVAAVDEPQRAPDDFLDFLKSPTARGTLVAAGLRPPAVDAPGLVMKRKSRDDR